MPGLAKADEAEHNGKQLVLAGMNPIVRDVFKVSGFDRMPQIEPDLETAAPARTQAGAAFRGSQTACGLVAT